MKALSDFLFTVFLRVGIPGTVLFLVYNTVIISKFNTPYLDIVSCFAIALLVMVFVVFSLPVEEKK